MKKSLILASIFAVTLAACGQDDEGDAAAPPAAESPAPAAPAPAPAPEPAPAPTPAPSDSGAAPAAPGGTQ